MRLLYQPIAGDWPGRLRTDEEREGSPFSAPWNATIDLLDREVWNLTDDDHALVVIQLELPAHAFRNDGGLKEGARSPDHPGVIISFDSTHGPLRYSTDRYAGWGRRGDLLEAR